MCLICALQVGGVLVNQAHPQAASLQLSQSPDSSPSHQPIREKSYTLGRSYDTASGRVVTLTTKDAREDLDVTMTKTSTDKTVTMETGRRAGEQVKIIPLSAEDDVISGTPLITIREVKTPTSPPAKQQAGSGTAVTTTTTTTATMTTSTTGWRKGAEVKLIPISVTNKYDIRGEVIGGRLVSEEEPGRGGANTLDVLGGGDSRLSPLTPITPFTPLSPLSPRSPLLPPKSPLDELHLSPAPPLGHLAGKTSPSMARVV